MLRIEDGPSRPPVGIFRWWCVPLQFYGLVRLSGPAINSRFCGACRGPRGPFTTYPLHAPMDEREHVTPARTMQTEVLARIWMDGGDETSFAGKHPRSLILHDHWAP